MKFRTNELFKNQIPRIYRHVNNKVNITDSSIFSQFTTFTLKYNWEVLKSIEFQAKQNNKTSINGHLPLLEIQKYVINQNQAIELK